MQRYTTTITLALTTDHALVGGDIADLMRATFPDALALEVGVTDSKPIVTLDDVPAKNGESWVVQVNGNPDVYKFVVDDDGARLVGTGDNNIVPLPADGTIQWLRQVDLSAQSEG